MASEARYPHLPAGHDPGRQTLRARRGAGVGFWMLLIFGLVFVGVGLWFLLISAPEAPTGKKHTGRVVGGWVFLGMSLFFFLLAWFIRHRQRGGSQATHLLVELSSTEFRVGDTVQATLRVLDAGKLSGDVLEFGLVCAERHDVEVESVDSNGNTTRSRQTRVNDLWTDWRTADRSAPQQTIDFVIPPDGAPSYEGETVSWAWRVSVREPRKMRADPHRDVAIWVRP